MAAFVLLRSTSRLSWIRRSKSMYSYKYLAISNDGNNFLYKYDPYLISLHSFSNNNHSNEDSKPKKEIPSFETSAGFIIKVPIIFFFVAFGGVLIAQAQQGAELFKLPEQYQYFKRYIAVNGDIIDELGIPVKITGGTTKIHTQNDNELNFSFGIEGAFGQGIVYCKRTIQNVESLENNDFTKQKKKI
eukprot:200815_1